MCRNRWVNVLKRDGPRNKKASETHGDSRQFWCLPVIVDRVCCFTLGKLWTQPVILVLGYRRFDFHIEALKAPATDRPGGRKHHV